MYEVSLVIVSHRISIVMAKAKFTHYLYIERHLKIIVRNRNYSIEANNMPLANMRMQFHLHFTVTQWLLHLYTNKNYKETKKQA